MTFLITAGPTREPIDPVRYLTNRSSGKMGYALAEAAQARGHRVILISGPTQIDVPDGVDFLPAETADEMFRAVERWITRAEVAVFSAAVADYTIATPAAQKIKKCGDTLTLELVKTRDILGSARESFAFDGTLVGFAAETEDLEANARKKLVDKDCDLVVANNVSLPGVGFDSNENLVELVYPDHTHQLPQGEKKHLAIHIIEAIEDLHLAKKL